MRIIKSNLWLQTLYKLIWYYPVPANITYLWNFGFLGIMVLIVQIVSGLFLAMHYIPHMDLAFASVEHIMRDVNGGWAMRYIHANGASFFFIVIYLHILRGIYFQSYRSPREHLWFSGVALFVLLMGTAFLGYLLPWGQMSFWGATVILSLVSVIPVAGPDIVEWLWGGFSVDGPTLTRLYVFHFTLPWVLVALTICHIILLHEYGSNNPLGSATDDTVPFFPFSTFKDLFALCLLGILFTIMVSFAPNFLGHPDNYIMANAMMTPAHIVPEWYFLPYYAVLRSVPDKRLGVLLMGAAILIVAFLPYLSQFISRNPGFSILYKLGFWLFVFVSLILGWIGGLPIVYPLYEIGQIATVLYFGYFLLYIPLASFIDSFVVKVLASARKSAKVRETISVPRGRKTVRRI